MPLWIAILNTLAGLASIGFAVAAFAKPDLIAPASASRTESRFYPAMYAARAIPLGLGVAVAVWLSPASMFLLIVLGIAVLAQLGDVAIGAASRQPGMIAGGLFGALCHGTAIAVLL